MRSTPLRRIRREREITQQELADQTGLSQQAIAKLERGHHRPSWDTAYKLSQALGIPPEQLFPFDEEGATA